MLKIQNLKMMAYEFLASRLAIDVKFALEMSLYHLPDLLKACVVRYVQTVKRNVAVEERRLVND